MWGEKRIKKLLSELILNIPALNTFDYQLPELEPNKQELELSCTLHLSIYLLIKQVFIQH
jgi:hypothetical protein